MKKLTSIICAFSFAFLQAVGFGADSLVTTESGRLKPIKDLTIGERVICYNKNFELVHSAIKGICAFTVESTVLITTETNDTIVASNLERFFLPQEGSWVFAQYLKEGDSLLNSDLEPVTISCIQQCNKSQELYAITVDKFHNFLISGGQYLVHNGVLAAWQAYWATKVTLYAALGVGVAGAMIATGGAVSSAAAAYTAGTATVTTVAGSIAVGGAVRTVSCGSTLSASCVGAATAAGTIFGGAELGITAGAAATGTSAIVTAAGSTAAGATGATGVCAATAAAIEDAATVAAIAVLTCLWTPW